MLAEIIKAHTGAKVRGIELSLLQRCGAHLASATDVEEACTAGMEAVRNAVNGVSGKMVAFEREMIDGKRRRSRWSGSTKTATASSRSSSTTCCPLFRASPSSRASIPCPAMPSSKRSWQSNHIILKGCHIGTLFCSLFVSLPCHSERREESYIPACSTERSFAALRMIKAALFSFEQPGRFGYNL